MDDFNQPQHGFLKKICIIFWMIVFIGYHSGIVQPMNVDMRDFLGQNIIIGIPNPTLDDNTRHILEEIKPAGIILYARNIQSLEQVHKLIQDLQNLAHFTTGYPYFIMLDEEPGGAGRLKVFRYVFPARTPDWSTIDRGVRVMSEAGINVDLAPLVDFPYNKAAFLSDRIPPIESPEDLTIFNRQFLEILHQHRIAGTLKHFPGLGVFIQDPHRQLVETSIEMPIFEESLKLFRAGISAGADFVMTGHSFYRNIDEIQPTTLSRILITDILQNQLDFKGLIITDDLSEMPITAIQNLSKEEIACGALMAGHHLLMYSHELDKTCRIFRNMLSKIEKDAELQKRLEDNYKKIVAFKKNKLGLFVK